MFIYVYYDTYIHAYVMNPSFWKQAFEILSRTEEVLSRILKTSPKTKLADWI